MSNSIKTISNLKTHSISNKMDDSFVGIKIRNGQIDFYYPNAYDFADEQDVLTLRKDIVYILSTIAIAKVISGNKVKIESTHSNNEAIALVSYLWVIKDYLKNGFYVNREKKFKPNQKGKVDWKRTLNTEPIISGGNIIYKTIITQVTNISDNLLVEIHKYCVKQSIAFIGWLFGINSSDFIETKPFSKKIYTLTLKQELSTTFDDTKKHRLNHMLRIIEGLSDDNNSDDIVYGVDTYSYIFEQMIDKIFGNRNASEFNPSATWHLKKNDYKGKGASKLRPDTVLVKDKIAYIVDAKFYQFGVTGLDNDLPETTSIQKQITYGEFIKKNKLGDEIQQIRNAFIMPYNKNNNKFGYNNNLEYIGFSKTDYKHNDEPHEIVHAFLIDLKHVISTYGYREHEEELYSLIKEIEKETLKMEFPL